MKKSILTTIASILCLVTLAQTVEKNFNLNGSSSFSIVADYPGIVVHAGDQNEVRVVADASINGIPVSQALEFDWNSSSNTLEIKTDMDIWEDWTDEEMEKYLEEMDCEDIKEQWLKKGKKWNNWSFDSDVNVYLPSKVRDLNIKSTYGSVVIDEISSKTRVFNTYGSIKASANQGFDHCDLESTYSKVTLNLKEANRSNVTLRSDYGEIYTDMDLDIDTKKSTHKQFKSIIKATLNNGGSNEISLRSDYSNVYLKKV